MATNAAPLAGAAFLVAAANMQDAVRLVMSDLWNTERAIFHEVVEAATTSQTVFGERSRAPSFLAARTVFGQSMHDRATNSVREEYRDLILACVRRNDAGDIVLRDKNIGYLPHDHDMDKPALTQ